MARINNAKLAYQVSEGAHRANIVRQDPAVIKAAQQAKHDTVQACKSIATLARETNESWHRNTPGNRVRFA